jgi:predicted transcriptional regulator
MLVRELMTDEVVCCTPWDTARTAAGLMKERGVGAIPVVSDTFDPLLEGIVDSVQDCEELMEENQVRRIPVVDKRGRCVGIVSQADIALRAPAWQVARMMREVSKSPKPSLNLHFDKDVFYSGLLHEQDEILLLNRRRELRQEVEAVR